MNLHDAVTVTSEDLEQTLDVLGDLWESNEVSLRDRYHISEVRSTIALILAERKATYGR